ncbi:hypothetical protein EDD18DRAFT_1464925 [Armillaria luteobubalina]|uniref:Uncharacterized protein n=1 Tax=Armillaria luteobubalina TaxID=153913 RepID=A0AA39ULW7_9AGAR|nr:hypothetical protein EDD18DRAFT_1464925 [Armillaria luteobubalina]
MALRSRIGTPSLTSKIETSYRPEKKLLSKGSEELASLVDELPADMVLDKPLPSQNSTTLDHKWCQLPTISPKTRDRESLPPVRTILGHALDLPIPINRRKRSISPFAIVMEGEENHRQPPFSGPLSLSDKPTQSQHDMADSQRADISFGTPVNSLHHRFSGPAYMDWRTFASPPTSPLEETEKLPAMPENGRRMSVIDRYDELLSDVQITEFDEHGAKCRVCEKVVRLGPTNMYTLGPWDRHKKSCTGSRFRRGRGFDVRAALSDVVGVVKADKSIVKDQTNFDIIEAMEERYHLMAQSSSPPLCTTSNVPNVCILVAPFFMHRVVTTNMAGLATCIALATPLTRAV